MKPVNFGFETLDSLLRSGPSPSAPVLAKTVEVYVTLPKSPLLPFYIAVHRPRSAVRLINLRARC